MSSISVLKDNNGRPVERVCIENARFIFNTNFQGDPNRDTYKSRERKGNVLIEDEEFAMALRDAGVNVKARFADDPERETQYFVVVKLNFDSWKKPKVYFVSGNTEPRLLDEDTISIVDDADISNVNIIANTYQGQNSEYKSLYVDTMYVEQDLDGDPFFDRYHN